MAAVKTLDGAVFDGIARWRAPGLDWWLRRLSTAASYSRIWMVIAAALAVFGGRRGRRTALEAMAAVGVTSAVANVAIKGLTRRQRPRTPVPESRRLEQPDSSSFPSGHAASAAAFSGVLGAEIPALRLPINALGAAVGFSRVYTGVHYPGDVVAGWFLGKACAFSVVRASRRFRAVSS